ncbi:MAG: CsgG/HfaB family protein [Brevinematales bacterium]|nr:CsgG/HfaB family protein [Brevinematales bacterium]
MKRVFFLLFLLTGVVFSEDKTKIAILEIENTTSKEIDTKFLAETLQMEIVSKKYFTVVERKMLSKIMEEKKLNLSGLTKEERAAQIGLLAGADSIWLGSITFLDEVYVLTLKSIDTKSGVIEYADQVYCKTEKQFLDIIPLLAERLYKKSKGENVEKFTLSGVTFKSASEVQDNDYSIGLRDGMEAGKKGGNFMYFIGGCLLPYGIGLILPFVFEPEVPMEHFIGKSSSYTVGFTTGYKKKAKDANFNQALAGCLAQLGVYLVIYIVQIIVVARTASSAGY